MTARGGLVAVGKLLRQHAQLPQVLDPLFPAKTGLADGNIAITYCALLSQGVTEFDATENMRRDATFARALGLPALPSSPTVRQRIESRGQAWLEPLFEANARLLTRAKVEPTALATGHVPVDLDVFVMDNSDSRKEGIGTPTPGWSGTRRSLPTSAARGTCWICRCAQAPSTRPARPSTCWNACCRWRAV
ncbi:MAG: hypothetical protein AMXMBFR25_03970 [Lysobacterales bacterium]